MPAAHKVDAGWKKGSPLAFIVIGSILAALLAFWFLSKGDDRPTATTEDGGVTTTESTASTSS
jgi:hypothetical protein